jgi:hypothetical protein
LMRELACAVETANCAGRIISEASSPASKRRPSTRTLRLNLFNDCDDSRIQSLPDFADNPTSSWSFADFLCHFRARYWVPSNCLINKCFVSNVRTRRDGDQEGAVARSTATPETPAEYADIILLRWHGTEGATQND